MLPTKPLHGLQSIEKNQEFHLPFVFEIFLLRGIKELKKS